MRRQQAEQFQALAFCSPQVNLQSNHEEDCISLAIHIDKQLFVALYMTVEFKSHWKERQWKSKKDQTFPLVGNASPTGFYAILEQWNRGYVPSNNSLHHALDQIKSSFASLKTENLCQDTKTLSSTIIHLCDTLHRAIKERNSDHLLQQLTGHLKMTIEHATYHSVYPQGIALTENIQIMEPSSDQRMAEQQQIDLIKSQIQKDTGNLLKLAQLAVMSSDFRSLIENIFDFLHNLIFQRPQTLVEDDVVSDASISSSSYSHYHQDHMPSASLHVNKAHVDLYASRADKTQKDIMPNLLDQMDHILKVLCKHKQFRDALLGLWLLLEHTQSLMKSADELALPDDRVTVRDANMNAAAANLITLIERYASHYPVDNLLQQWARFLTTMSKKCTEDFSWQDMITDWKVFLKQAKRNEYRMSDAYRTRGRFLLKRLMRLIEDNHLNQQIEHLVSENQKLMQCWKEDDLTSEISKEINQLTNLPNENQSTELLQDVRATLLPHLLRAAHDGVPLPPISFTDRTSKTKVQIDQTSLPTSIFAPLNIAISSTTEMTRRDSGINPFEQETEWISSAHVSATGMRGQVPNVRFSVDRSKWPKFHDHGWMDLSIGSRSTSRSAIAAPSGLAIAADIRINDDKGTHPSSCH